MAKTRTFVGIAVSNQIRRAADGLVQSLRPLAGDFRWTPAENLHYTLHFLGDLTDTEIVEVCDRVGRVAADCGPYALAARGVGAFPSLDRPRTLWIGSDNGTNQTVALYESIGQQLADLGCRGENRRFVPHLTVGKLSRQGRGATARFGDELSRWADFDAGTMTVEHLTVFASELSREGPHYHVLSRASLQGL